MKSKDATRFALLSLFVAVILLRLASNQDSSLVNLAPVAAIALCFGLYVQRSMLAVVLAFSALFISDAMISYLAVRQDPSLSMGGLLFSPAIGVRYLVYAGIFGLAWSLRGRRSLGLAFGLTPASTVGFYGVMNTVAWLSSAPPFAYAKTFAGWWQSQTVGLPIPGAPPSYVFLRNALVGDALFTCLFVALLVWLPARVGRADSALNVSKSAV